MILFVVALGCIIVASISVSRRNDNSILSYYDTTVMNGIATICIFLTHSTQYFNLSSGVLDRMYSLFQGMHGQFVVAGFLAFSGYGCMSQIDRRGRDYISDFSKHRILKTFLNFDVAIFIYIILSICVDDHYSLQEYIGSFLGITSIGNSNWYIFSIMLMYTFTYVASNIFYPAKKKIALLIAILTIIYMLISPFIGLSYVFYSTVLCYPFGIFLYIEKNEIINHFKSHKILSIVSLTFVLVITHSLRGNAYIMDLVSCIFVLICVWFLTFFEVKSRFLFFIGKHCFSIFILQRIPMRLLFGNPNSSSIIKLSGFDAYWRVAACFAITLCISILFDIFLQWFDYKLFQSNNNLKN